MRASEVFRAALSARPGQVLVYHVGVCLGERPELFTEATHAARHLYNEGLVMLAQRRKASGGTLRFEYLAIWRKHRARRSDLPVVRIASIDGRAWAHATDKGPERRYAAETRFDVPSHIRAAWAGMMAA